jgi:methyl-accepting chemotaxis protein
MIAFNLLALIVAVVGYQGMRGMSHTAAALKDIHFNMRALAELKDADVDLIKLSRVISNGVVDGAFKDVASLEKRVEHLNRYDGQFRTTMDSFAKGLVLAEIRAKTADVMKDYEKMLPQQRKILDLVKAGKVDEAHGLMREARNEADVFEKKLTALVDAKAAAAKVILDEAEASVGTATNLLLGFMVAAVVLAVGTGIFIGRLIARPLAQAARVLETVAAGDFTRTLDVDTKDEVGQMATALNAAVEAMRTALHEVSLAANHAASASQQLSAASEQLSSGAQQQASSLEETAASLEEITGTVRQNADNARQASQLAVGSRSVAEQGGQVVANAVTSMAEINKASKKIADIITTIDEIAFQTNLLALNAAVEAARAGEQGRGFAVVAAEVRNLAQRSATAAKEIKDLIQDSVQKVEAGSDLVNKSGETLGEIVASVKRVTDIIAEIAAASEEQTSGIDQVNKAVTQMDQVTQANAAQTEELTSTAQALATQAKQLQGLVARFHLGDERTRQARPAAATVSAPAARPASVSAPAARPTAPVSRRAGTAPAPTSIARSTPVPSGPALAGAANGHGARHTRDDGFEEF